MKRTMLALLVPLLCYMQKGTAATTVVNDSLSKTSIFLKDRNIYYQKVFTSNLSKDELSDKVAVHLSTIPYYKHKNDSYFTEGDFIGYLSNNTFKINRPLTFFNVPTLLHYPMDAMVAIQVKDNRYRVTVSEMAFKVTKTDSIRTVTKRYPLEGEVTRKSGSEIKPSKQKILDTMEQYFTNLFDLGKSAIATDF
ncbi:hypothetical protein [Pedobacter frigoris]|uniref:hypothetical protein n=1 Tax=Pedobacter frigoris TaxID=2571272 RepID=UPI0029311955|nr:hypothetical protein [Pedobacter frigoris]